MKCVALCALASVLALSVAGCGDAANRIQLVQLPHNALSHMTVLNGGLVNSRGPFVPNGGFVSLGAHQIFMGDGQITSCVPGRLYAQAVDLRNRSKNAVTLIGATGEPELPLRVIAHIATQVRLEPRPRSMTGEVTLMRRWSAARARPVTIPAGRSAIVQSNFRMAHCEDLSGGRTVVLPGEVFLRYLAGGATDRQTAVVPESRIVLMQGAAEHSCGPRIAGGSSNVVAANVSCRIARKAAVACRRLWDGGTCESDGKWWDCVAGESCWVPRQKSHWFEVSSRPGA
jgi:hypothetical protein